MAEQELEALRAEIDKLDSTLVEALEARFGAVRKVAAYKDARHMAVLDREREQRVLAKAVDRLHDKAYAPQLQAVLEQVMAVSRDLQIQILADNIRRREQCGNPVRAGYQGVQGSFSHQALEEYFAGVPTVEMNYVHFEDVVVAVKHHEIKYGVLPIENSSTGGITEVYDLIRRYDCHIVGEKSLKVDQNLLALPGTKLEDIRKVYSHPQGFEQSRAFFRKHPSLEFVPFFNTARSAKMVAESGDKTKAAIASKQAAKLYGLTVLAEHINYNNANTTRFIVVADEPEHRPDANKITVVIATKHEPGSLYKVLGHFYDCGLNMTNLESRPIDGRSWEYFFHIDLTGNLDDPKVRQGLQEIAEHSAYCKILGNYVSDEDVVL
ncbi:MAG: Bifunctional chorismate mutase/prephenate dehydratase [Succiniclasticum sp.]|jgi:chorismate mutase / prephenate dehydratase